MICIVNTQRSATLRVNKPSVFIAADYSVSPLSPPNVIELSAHAFFRRHKCLYGPADAVQGYSLRGAGLSYSFPFFTLANKYWA